MRNTNSLNLLKSPIPQWREKWKSDPESESGIGAPPNVNQLFRLVTPIITPSSKFQCNRLITFLVICSQHDTHTHTHTQTHTQTEQSHNLCGGNNSTRWNLFDPPAIKQVSMQQKHPCHHPSMKEHIIKNRSRIVP